MNTFDNIGGWARPEERPFLRRVFDTCEAVRAQNLWRLTDFLSPREQHLLTSIVRREGLVVSFEGGSVEAERKRALVMPDEWYPQDEDFHVSILFARTLSGQKMSHGSVLGSVLGTGLDRRKIGDIFPHPTGVHVAVCDDVTRFLQQEWVQVGRETITIDQANAGQVLRAQPYVQERISVASLRADAVLAQACHWSRSAGQEAIHKGHVSLNFSPLDRVDVPIEIGDLLSVRGFGRIRVLELEGESRKGRHRVLVGILKSDSSP